MADSVDGTYDLCPFRSYRTDTVDGVLQGTCLFAVEALGGTPHYAEEDAARVLGSRGLGKMRPDDAAYIEIYIAFMRHSLGTGPQEPLGEDDRLRLEGLDVSPLLREIFILEPVESTPPKKP